MEVWPPPPTNGPPLTPEPRRRPAGQLTHHVWLDIVIGIVLGLLIWPVAAVLCIVIALIASPNTYLNSPQTVMCMWGGWAAAVSCCVVWHRAYRFVWRGVGGVLVLAWLPIIALVAPYIGR